MKDEKSGTEIKQNLITGVGGVFIFSDKPQELADWYSKIFGFNFESSPDSSAFYQTFITLDKANTSKKLDFHFSIIRANQSFKKESPKESKSMYGDQNYMINIRTENLEKLLENIRNHNIEIVKTEEWDYGKFAWIIDPEGNRIELYQPL